MSKQWDESRTWVATGACKHARSVLHGSRTAMGTSVAMPLHNARVKTHF